MKSVLLGLAMVAFAVTSASAECSFGMAKMSHAKPQTNLAQSQPVSEQKKLLKELDYASLKDAWLIKYLT
ncbi:MAG: hypothetical protein WBC71_12365 [Salaquimonas sp.]